ncbi:MAG: hypothetical protein PUB07_03815 [Clostridia bacterium]|nr:hypothetical protein [Clostridia bacterium]
MIEYGAQKHAAENIPTRLSVIAIVKKHKGCNSEYEPEKKVLHTNPGGAASDESPKGAKQIKQKTGTDTAQDREQKYLQLICYGNSHCLT